MHPIDYISKLLVPASLLTVILYMGQTAIDACEYNLIEVSNLLLLFPFQDGANVCGCLVHIVKATFGWNW